MRLTSREDAKVLLVALCLAGLLLVPLPVHPAQTRTPALVEELQNLGHPLAFGWLTYLIIRFLGARAIGHPIVNSLVALAAAAAFGLATEAAQALTGRSSSWRDIANDLLGAGFAALLYIRASYSRAGVRRTASLAALVIALALVTPLSVICIAYMERETQMPTLWKDESIGMRYFSKWQTGKYTGLAINEPTPDWRAWEFLEIDVEGGPTPPTHATVRVHDRAHNQLFVDRYNEEFPLNGGERVTWRIPLERIRNAPLSRSMNLADIGGVVIFASGSDQKPPFIVHEVRLAR